MGLNLVKGLGLLPREEPRYDILQNFQRFDVEKKGGLPIVPADVFDRPAFVQIVATRWPTLKRMEEVRQLLGNPPWAFGDEVDAAMIMFVAEPIKFDEYRAEMDALAAAFPRVRWIHCTLPVNLSQVFPNRRVFNEALIAHYKGKEPIYDLAAILSGDFKNGDLMLPEYSHDPTGVHPDQNPAMIQMARGFLLVLKESSPWKQGAAPAKAAVASPTASSTSQVAPGTLAADQSEYLAVRAILDRNGLKEAKVEGHVDIRDGHVVGLSIQEAGVIEIPDAIGELTHLERLHVYADRDLKLPYLQKVSPAIGKCENLQELLLNGNELKDLPVEITQLKKIKTLSIADNQLQNLPAEVEAWVRIYDPQGLKKQR
jgi:hypothetical protein